MWQDGLYVRQDEPNGDSGADEAGVEGAGEGDVGGALDEGAAVGEEGEGVGRTLEAEEEVVEADRSPWGLRRSRMAAKSTGRWCSWIWTELRPQRVMWGRPSPARWEKMRWPQTVQAGLGVLVLISLRSFVHRSWERRVRRMRWGWLVRSLRASVAWMEAARLTAVERMPAVSQVSTGPVGGLGKMQARQAVGSRE